MAVDAFLHFSFCCTNASREAGEVVSSRVEPGPPAADGTFFLSGVSLALLVGSVWIGLRGVHRFYGIALWKR